MGTLLSTQNKFLNRWIRKYSQFYAVEYVYPHLYFSYVFIFFQLILLLGGIPFLWNLSGDLLGKYGYSGYEVGILAKLSLRFMSELIEYQHTQAFS